MATVKKGVLVHAGEWWKHLRWTKRSFWKRERRVAEDEAEQWALNRADEDAAKDEADAWVELQKSNLKESTTPDGRAR